MKRNAEMVEQRRTTDASLRSVMRSVLAKRFSAHDDVIIVEELPVWRGQSRLDFAVVDTRISGIELKSSEDTLTRLPRQAEHFSTACDLMTLVAAPKHVPGAIDIVPDWWKIVTATPTASGAIKLSTVRRGRLNPGLEHESLVRLLERSELLAVLSRRSLGKGVRTATWRDLAARVRELVPLRELKVDACRLLKSRAQLAAQFTETSFGARAFGNGMQSPAFGPLSMASALSPELEPSYAG